jgi:hypothetical protein
MKTAASVIKKFPATKQRRMDRLLDKNSEGTISAAEKIELRGLVKEAEELTLANAKRLLEFTKGESARPSANAVPVIVWVEPQRDES